MYTELPRACSCGQGFRSRLDGKCWHCRTKSEKYDIELFRAIESRFNLQEHTTEHNQWRVAFFGKLYVISN